MDVDFAFAEEELHSTARAAMHYGLILSLLIVAEVAEGGRGGDGWGTRIDDGHGR